MIKAYVFLNDIDTSHVAVDKRECWMPHSGAYFDPVMRQTFDSRTKKRAYLKAHGMRECGELINPEKQIGGREKTRRNPQRAAIRQYLDSCGGTEGLLKRIQEGRGHFL